MPRVSMKSSVVAAAITLAAGHAIAVPLPPGGSVSLPGGCPAGGVIVRDTAVPFTIRDRFGLTLSGTVQDRIIRLADGSLRFSPRIRNVSGSSALGISRVIYEGFTGFSTDVDWLTCGLGSGAPTNATRTGDGDDIDYSFSFSPIFRGGESRFFFATTDADQFALTGSMTLQLEDGSSTTIQLSAPIIDTTPPEVRITSPSPEACVCPDAMGVVSFSGEACDLQSDMAYRMRVRRSSGADGTGWIELTPTTTERCSPGLLAQWNATGQPAGDYIVELEAVNQVGLVSTAALEFRLNTAASPASIRTPVDGEIIGGNTCLDGTVGEDCFSNYRVEFRPAGGGSYMPVDGSSPIYTGRVVNDPIAFWNTRTVLDGDYQVRVRVSDICGNTADVVRTYEIDNTAPVGRITSLVPCEWVNGKVEIKGEVFDKNIASWVLEYTGGSSRGWTRIDSGTDNIPAGGVIAVWDTEGLDRCAYTVRLRVTDKARVGCFAPSGNGGGDMVSVNVGCEADLDGNGVLDIFDFLMFSNIFAAGCP